MSRPDLAILLNAMGGFGLFSGSGSTPNPSAPTVHTFVLTAGALVRKSVIYEIRKAAQMSLCDIEVSEHKGLIESEYTITLHGRRADVEGVRAVVDRIVKALAS